MGYTSVERCTRRLEKRGYTNDAELVVKKKVRLFFEGFLGSVKHPVKRTL